jgi:Flp pilus assembly protein TadD
MGAISDYNKAIELDPNNASAYYNRAISKYYTNDLNGACEDARKSSSLGNPFPEMIEAACN